MKIIPLGLQCSVPEGIKNSYLRECSYPFDWLWTPSKTTYNILNILMNESLDKAVEYMTTGHTYYKYIGKEKYISVDNITECQMNKISGLGNTHFKINNEYKNTLKRRLERLLKDIKSNENILFLYADSANSCVNYGLDGVEYGLDATEYLLKIYELIYPVNNNIKIVYFCWNERKRENNLIEYISFDFQKSWIQVSELIKNYCILNLKISNKYTIDFLTENSKKELLKEYENTYPFKFKVIDNFFTDETIEKILSSTSQLQPENSNYSYLKHGQKWESKKYAYTQNFPVILEKIFQYLNSDEFIDYIEKTTGITGIIRNDTTLDGAGIHQIYNGGYLNIHTDFNTTINEKHGKLDRRINLLLYLNPDWKEEYNGHLQLYDRKKCKCSYKILPILNRCVIFNTTKESLHGHPVPLNLPREDMKKESIAVYYYTKNVNDIDFEGVNTHRPLMIYKTEIFNNDNVISI